MNEIDAFVFQYWEQRVVADLSNQQVAIEALPMVEEVNHVEVRDMIICRHSEQQYVGRFCCLLAPFKTPV